MLNLSVYYMMMKMKVFLVFSIKTVDYFFYCLSLSAMLGTLFLSPRHNGTSILCGAWYNEFHLFFGFCVCGFVLGCFVLLNGWFVLSVLCQDVLLVCFVDLCFVEMSLCCCRFSLFQRGIGGLGVASFLPGVAFAAQKIESVFAFISRKKLKKLPSQ